MNTLKTIMEAADLTNAGVRLRIKSLGITERYERINGRPTRVFTDDEADRLINYVPKKPGRKKKRAIKNPD